MADNLINRDRDQDNTRMYYIIAGLVVIAALVMIWLMSDPALTGAPRNVDTTVAPGAMDDLPPPAPATNNQ